VALRKLFGGKQQPSESDYTIDDLIVLERFEEAQARLEAKVKQNLKDLHSHLRLADVLISRGKVQRALDEFLFVADSYVEDGFYDKGIALLAKATKFAPGDPSLQQKIARLQRTKTLEHSRVFFIEGLAQGEVQEGPLARRSLVELQLIWSRLSSTRLVDSLAPEVLKKLVSAMELHQLPADTTIALRGASEGRLLLIITGNVEAILERQEGGYASLRSFTTGDVLGESCLFEQRPWPCTLVAREAGRAFTLDRAGLERALVGNPDPRAMVEVLRSQRHDIELGNIVRRLLGGAG